MKKYNKIIVLSLSMFMIMPSAFSNNDKMLICSTTDVFNEKDHIEKILLKQVKNDENLLYSNMYVQFGSDNEGNKYLRFATAVKGNIEKLNYKMFINNEEYIAGRKSADVLYKSILSNGERLYYDGNNLTTNSSDYLWTCFTIKFTSEKYNNDNIEVKLIINDNDKYNASKSTSLINEMNVSPSYIEAEECVFKLNQNEETDEKWTDNVTNLTSAEYFDENNKSVQQWGIYNGASGNMIEKLTNNAKNLYFKFKVTAPKADDYQLFARVQSDFDESSLSVAEGVYKISIDNEPEVLSNEFTIYPANQLKNYVDTKDLKYARYYNMEWWNYVKLGTLHLKQGENTIKIKIDNSLNVRVPNIDFFEIKTNDYTINNEIYSMRTKKKVDLTKNSIYLTQGEELTDLCVARFGSEPLDSRCPTKYTYIYVRLDDGREIPVLPSMLSNLDYQKIGEQEVTATIKNLTNNKVEITKSFKVIIQENMKNKGDN